ncbi:hypothetical protein B5X24_HaOG215903 [Helicoverpa armigera]|nr:hypothetical protein B5X24_HaOG215903 [Helicoverpa armigera]
MRGISLGLEFCGQRGGSGGGAGAAGSYAYNQMDRPSNTAARERGGQRAVHSSQTVTARAAAAAAPLPAKFEAEA